MPDDEPDHTSDDADATAEPARRRSAWLWHVGRAAGLIGTGLVLAVILGLLALQTDTGATATARWLAEIANPLSGTTLAVERASGNWLQSLRLTGVTLTRRDSATGESLRMARVDTLAVRYRLLPLLQGRVHVTTVTVDGPSVTMRQAADSTWDWGRVLPSTEASDTSGAMPVQVDQVNVTDGALQAKLYAKGRDSTAKIRNLQVQARDLRTAPALTGQLDTLGLRARSPLDSTLLALGIRGSLQASMLRLDTLRLDSPRSRVYGQGKLRLPMTDTASGTAAPLENVSFHLRAAPLALRDLIPLFPAAGLDPAETVRLDVQGSGSGRRLSTTVDAAFSSGGALQARLSATPTVTPSAGDSLHYHLDATARRLTTSLVGPPDSLRNRVNATTDIDLSGPALDALSGTARFRFTDTRWGGLRVPRGTLTLALRNGRADIDLDGTLNDAAVRMQGTARPFDDAPSTRLDATVKGLDIAAFAPAAGISSDLSATARLEGTALGTGRSTLDATLDLAPSRLASQPLHGGSVSLAARPDRARLTGTVDLPDGRLRADGSVRLDGSQRFTLDSLRLDRVDVAALAGDSTDSRVTGTLQAGGQGFVPSTMQLDAELSLQDSRYGPYQLTALTAQTRLSDGRLAAKARTTLNGGVWSLAASGRPFAAVPSVEITKGRFQNVDIGPWLQDTTQSSALNGTFQGKVAGTTPDALRLDATLQLDSSRINRQRVDGAVLSAQLRAGRVTADATLTTPDGRAEFAGTARPFTTTPTFRLTDGAFEGLDVGALTGTAGLATSLSGSASLDGRGTTPTTLALDADLTLSSSTINDATLSRGRLTTTVADGRASAEGRFALAGGHLTVGGAVDSLTATPAYDLQVGLGALDAAALAGRDSLVAQIDTMRWTLDGRGTALSTLRGRTDLTAQNVRLDRFVADTMVLRGRLQEGRLAVDTLGLASNVLSAEGSGTLALTDTTTASQLAIQGTIADVQPLQRLVGAETLRLQDAAVEARVYGTAENQRFDGSVELTNFVYNDLRLASAELNVNGAREAGAGLRRAEVSGTLGYLSLPATAVEETRLQAIYDGTTVAVSSALRLDPTHTADLEATVTPLAERTEVRLRRLDLRLGSDRWSLARPTTVVAGTQYRIDSLRLQSGEQMIRANGTVDPAGMQDFSVQADSVTLGGVSPLFGFSGLGGSLSGTLALTGPAAAPRLDGRLDLGLKSGGEPVGTMQLDVGYDDLALALDATLTHANGAVLTADGSVPADLRLSAPAAVDVSGRPVRLNLSTEAFPIGWVGPFLDPATARDVQGTATADVTVRGSLDNPTLDGTASLQDGAVFLPALGTNYYGARASLRLADNQVIIDESVVRSGDGRLQANGVVNFPQLTVGTYDLSVDASDFRAVDTRAYRGAVIDGSMRLQGTTQQPELDGRIVVNSADAYYTEITAASKSSVATVPLTRDDQLSLEQRFGLRVTAADTTTFDLYEALAMDLSVRLRRDTWLRSRGTPQMDIQMTGDLDLDKAHGGEPQVYGSIQVVEGRSSLRQFGQEFQITEGTITFNGDPYAPYLNLAAVYEQRARGSQEAEVAITLSLEGRPDELSPTLSSEPPMATRNILSYLATGRPADELLGGDGAISAGGGNGGGSFFGAQILLGQATNFVENLAARELGLDVVRVQVRPSGTSYLTLGRYFSPRFYVSTEVPVSPSTLSGSSERLPSPDLTLEYQLTDTFLLRTVGNQGSFQLNLLFEYAY